MHGIFNKKVQNIAKDIARHMYWTLISWFHCYINPLPDSQTFIFMYIETDKFIFECWD